MHLVDDIDFIPSLCRPVGYLLTDFTDVVDTVVRCRVDLDDVRGNARQNRLTRRTFVARASVHGMFAVDRAGENLGDRRFSCSAGSAEQIRMTDAVRADLIFQCCYNVILSFYILKGGRTEFSVQSSIAHKIFLLLLHRHGILPPAVSFGQQCNRRTETLLFLL